MKKLIIKIDPLVEDEDAIKAVSDVINQGKISNTSYGRQYCFHAILNDRIDVSVFKRKSGTEVFWVRPYNKEIKI